MDVSLDPVKVGKAYKSLKHFARRLGVPYTTVREWRDGIPKWRIPQIQSITLADGHDVFRASKKRKADAPKPASEAA